MGALSKIFVFERRKGMSQFNSDALKEESDPRINDVVLSTGNISIKNISSAISFLLRNA